MKVSDAYKAITIFMALGILYLGQTLSSVTDELISTNNDYDELSILWARAVADKQQAIVIATLFTGFYKAELKRLSPNEMAKFIDNWSVVEKRLSGLLENNKDDRLFSDKIAIDLGKAYEKTIESDKRKAIKTKRP